MAVGASRVVGGAYYRLKSAVVDRLRRGGRTIIWTPQDGLGAGNQMYLWLHASIRRAAGEDVFVLGAPSAVEWIDRFPRLEEVVVARSSVRFDDIREGTGEPWLHQRFGSDFTQEQLDAFVEAYLLPDLRVGHDRTVVNVRRGDFYTRYRDKYGFDVASYLEQAMPSTIDRLLVVSDDPAWCRTELGAVLDRGGEVEFAPAGAVSQFEAVAGAGHLVLTNSTFGYWGGYVASLRGASVTVPWLHARGINGDAAYQLLPSWSVVQPGSWDGVPPAD